MWICCFSCGGAGMNKFFLLQQNSESFQMIWFVISLRSHGALMSDGVLHVSSGDAHNQTKGPWCYGKETCAHRCGGLAKSTGEYSWRHACVWEAVQRKWKVTRNTLTGPPPHLWGKREHTGASSRPACHRLVHSYSRKWLQKYGRNPPPGLTWDTARL